MCYSITFNNSTNSPKNSKVEGIIPILLQCVPTYVLCDYLILLSKVQFNLGFLTIGNGNVSFLYLVDHDSTLFQLLM